MLAPKEIYIDVIYNYLNLKKNNKSLWQLEGIVQSNEHYIHK